jgi:Cd2+/Zn2+-exporting ATPase
MRQNLVIAVLTVLGLLAGVYGDSIHMAGGMLVHQLSVLIVILNGMRLLRVPVAPRTSAAIAPIPERAVA